MKNVKIWKCILYINDMLNEKVVHNVLAGGLVAVKRRADQNWEESIVKTPE